MKIQIENIKNQLENINNQLIAVNQQLTNKKALRKLNKLTKKRYFLMAKLFVLNIKEKEKEILEKHFLDKHDCHSFYDFVNYFEQLDFNQVKIYDLFTLLKVTKAYTKLNKIQYLIQKKQSKLKKKKKYIHQIEELNTYINDKENFLYHLYHTKLIKKLEKLSRKQKEKQARSAYVIDLKNVCKYYFNKTLATKVLKNVNLQINRGEFIVILGPSGSGKTTLLNIISGMDNATYGLTNVANQNLINLNQSQLTNFRRKNIGYVFQQYGLLPNLTVRENVEIGANLQKNKSKRVDIDDLLKTIGIFEHKNKFPHELSGGQQQRVSIARSIVKNPEIIFGDEPTGAVDTEMSKQIMSLFLEVNKKYKTTIVIVTHNPVIAELATTVIKVANGGIEKIIHNKRPKTVDEIKWY